MNLHCAKNSYCMLSLVGRFGLISFGANEINSIAKGRPCLEHGTRPSEGQTWKDKRHRTSLDKGDTPTTVPENNSEVRGSVAIQSSRKVWFCFWASREP